MALGLLLETLVFPLESFREIGCYAMKKKEKKKKKNTDRLCRQWEVRITETFQTKLLGVSHKLGLWLKGK